MYVHTKSKQQLTTDGDGTWMLGTALGLTWFAIWQRMTPSAKAIEMSSGKVILSLDSISSLNWLMWASAVADFSTSLRAVYWWPLWVGPPPFELWWSKEVIFNLPKVGLLLLIMLDPSVASRPLGEGCGMEVVEAARPLARPLFLEDDVVWRSGWDPRPATDLEGLVCLD